MEINTDNIIIYRFGFIKLNATLLSTWFMMAVVILCAYFAGKNIKYSGKPGKFQGFLESAYIFARGQVNDIIKKDSTQFMTFLVSLFVFISASAFLNTVPLYHPPTASLSTTSALAICVFFAVPAYGIRNLGVGPYFLRYFSPNIIMAPFHLISEITRTLALALRLFGNTMSGTLVVSVLFMLVPLFVPLFMQMFEILIGTVQAYIFFILSAVFIGAAVSEDENRMKGG